MFATINKPNLGLYINRRFDDIKKDLSTEYGRADKLNYLSRLSELVFLANEFGFESLRKQISDYMNENL